MSSYLDRHIIDAIAERIFLAMDQKDADGSMHHGFMIGFHEGVSFMATMDRKKALEDAHSAMVRARQEHELEKQSVSGIDNEDQTDEGMRIRPVKPSDCSGGAHVVI